ncbi:MAG: site-specific integrase [Halanaerobiales bacterium]
MEKVEPIRDREKIEEMKNELLKSGFRNYLLFILGINTGLRISDLLSLKVRDVKERSHILIKEKKTEKNKRFLINSQLKQEIKRYIKGMTADDYLFKSQKGINQPISRVQAYRILKKAGNELGLESVGTHTLRKTFGYWHYQQYKDVALLQELFNHSAPSITLDYIGINQDVMDKTIEGFYL